MTDPYVYAESGVLRNRGHIHDPDLLRRAEAATSAAAIYALQTEHLPGDYDLVHLQAFHRRIFGRIYP